MVGLGMSLPTQEGQVGKYLSKLKDAALHLRTLHAQFHYDVRLAVSKQDIQAAIGRWAARPPASAPGACLITAAPAACYIVLFMESQSLAGWLLLELPFPSSRAWLADFASLSVCSELALMLRLQRHMPHTHSPTCLPACLPPCPPPPPTCRIRALARKLGIASGRVLGKRGASRRSKSGRERFPTVSSARPSDATPGMAAELGQVGQQEQDGGGRASAAAAATDGPGAAGQGLVVEQHSRGHLVVTQRPQSEVALVQQSRGHLLVQVPVPAVMVQPVAAPASARAAVVVEPEAGSAEAPTAAGAALAAPADGATAAAAPSTAAAADRSSDEGSTPKHRGSVAAPSTVGTSPASDAHLLAGGAGLTAFQDSPAAAALASAGAAAAGTVRGGVRKAMGGRLTRALRRLRLGGGAKPGSGTEEFAGGTPSGAAAAPAAVAPSPGAAAATDVRATTSSIGSATSAQQLLGERLRRSDVASVGEEGTTASLEAVPEEGSPVGHLAPGAPLQRSSETDAAGASTAEPAGAAPAAGGSAEQVLPPRQQAGAGWAASTAAGAAAAAAGLPRRPREEADRELMQSVFDAWRDRAANPEELAGEVEDDDLSTSATSEQELDTDGGCGGRSVRLLGDAHGCAGPWVCLVPASAATGVVAVVLRCAGSASRGWAAGQLGDHSPQPSLHCPLVSLQPTPEVTHSRLPPHTLLSTHPPHLARHPTLTPAVRSPPVMWLGVHNSRIDVEGASGCTRITLYAPYWLNNRTGVDLFYQDRASAPGNPLLFGAALPWDYGEVFTPGGWGWGAGMRASRSALGLRSGVHAWWCGWVWGVVCWACVGELGEQLLVVCVCVWGCGWVGAGQGRSYCPALGP